MKDFGLMSHCPVCNKLLPAYEEKCDRCGWSANAGCGLLLLSFLIPLFGIIYGIASMGHSPKKAKSCLLAAFAPVIAGLIIFLIFLIVSVIVGVSVA